MGHGEGHVGCGEGREGGGHGEDREGREGGRHGEGREDDPYLSPERKKLQVSVGWVLHITHSKLEYVLQS